MLRSVHYDDGGQSTEEEEEQSLQVFKVMCADPTDMKQNSAGFT